MNNVVYVLLEAICALFMVFIALILISASALFVRGFIDHWKKSR